MKHAIQLPLISFRGKRYFVDVRLGEIREVDVLTTIPFTELEKIATPREIITLVGAIADYYHSVEEAM